MDTICKLFLELSEVVSEGCKTRRQVQWEADDNSRRMRISMMLWPYFNANQHSAVSWGDVIREIQQRIGGKPNV